ncbi:hypothetical protein E2C01_019754 [Portunus trituberculatus]|uniref:Uncharacterized protein n=1 Tax=Portunus trituberculatus TaxID=210409 RepID=A0A5B7DYH3_PORTR|nr:hypothetical protein [Portunus trituberculatus]
MLITLRHWNHENILENHNVQLPQKGKSSHENCPGWDGNSDQESKVQTLSHQDQIVIRSK